MKKALTVTLISTLSLATAACAADVQTHMADLLDIAPYPAVEAGQARHVIWLPEKDNDDLFMVELVPGKVMQTDCNTRGFSATLTTETLAGWGYNYYELTNVTGPITTMMACPEGTEKEAFVAAQGDNFMLRYNSLLPIVVYAPQGIEVRYRIWSGQQTLQTAHQ